MDNTFLRTEMLLGSQALRRLQNCRVAVFGLGGVGGAAVEALARTGVGALTLVDGDVFSPSNLNRQLAATQETVGKPKAQVWAQRLAEIVPSCRVTAHNLFFLPDSPDVLTDCDLVIDAVDTVTAKLEIIRRANERGIPVLSAMGTGNKRDLTRLQVTDIYQTAGCPLAKVMRKELRARGVERLTVVYSPEPPAESRLSAAELLERGEDAGRRLPPASAIFVPAAAGLLLAQTAVEILTGKEEAYG